MSLRRWVASTLALSAVVSSVALAVPAGAAPSTAGSGSASSAPSRLGADRAVSAAGSYWTKERMLSARPVPVPKLSAAENRATKPGRPDGAPGRVDGVTVPQKSPQRPGGGTRFGSSAYDWYGSSTSAPATTSGKVFFTGSDGLPYVCSASTVNSTGKTVVMTAGHCVSDGAGRWYNQQPWIFVPGYKDGNAPYGQWSARQLWTRTAWLNGRNRAEDIGAALMYPLNGVRIVNRVGGQGIEWNYPLSQYVYQFGYPQRAPFNGARLKYCTGSTYSDGGFEGINCNMTEGASGGPWLDDFGGTFGYLDTVNSWVFWNGSGVRYKWNGPYFGNNARDFFASITAAEV